MAKNDLSKVSIIIPTKEYNIKVAGLINLLLRQDAVPDEILVVTKEDYLGKYVSKHRCIIKILHQKGKGPANARNLGAQHATGEILVFIDSDCVPANKNCLLALLSEFDKTNVDIICGRVIVPDDNFFLRFVGAIKGLGTPDYGEKAFHVKDHFISFPATNIAIRKDVFILLGSFDEQLLIAEDVDFFWRAWNKGKKIRYVPKALIIHQHRRSFQGLIKHAFQTGRGVVNFLRKYGFYNSFLKGTFLSALLVPFSIIFLIAFSLLPILIFIPVIGYILLAAYFFRKSGLRSECILFPSVILLYSFFLGLGIWTSYLARRFPIHYFKTRKNIFEKC